MNKVLVIRAFLLAIVSAAFVRAEGKPATCGDLLAELRKRPKQLEFLGCKAHTGEQGKPLEATYRVKAVYAAEVERYLSDAFLMGRLKKTCCVWGADEIGFQWKDGNVYDLSMGTEETLIDKRSEWRKVPYFYVKFSRQTEAP